MNDLSAKRELALEAKDIIESKAFDAAKARIKERLLNAVISRSLTTEQKLDIVAQLQVIDGIANELRAQINDYNAAVRKNQSPSGLAQGRSAA